MSAPPPPFRCNLMYSVPQIRALQEHATPRGCLALTCCGMVDVLVRSTWRRCHVSVVSIGISEPSMLVLTEDCQMHLLHNVPGQYTIERNPTAHFQL